MKSRCWLCVLLGPAILAVVALLGRPPVSVGDDTKEQARRGKAADKRFTFRMQAVPWKKVFEWLADQGGLPVVASQVPTGTFTFLPPVRGKAPRTFSLAEIVDVVNEALLVSKHLLVRRPHSLHLVATDEPFDAALAPLVNPNELTAHPRTAIVRLLLSLNAVEAKEALAAIKSLLGPFGQALPVGNRLLVRDTVANLQQVLRVVQEVTDGRDADAAHFDYRCSYIKASEAKRLLEELMPAGPSRPGQSSKLTLAIDERSNTLHLRGPADLIAQARAILTKVDIAPGKAPQGESPVLKVYLVPSGAEALARTLQEPYRNSSVRIAAAGASRILVYAPPDVQLAIARHMQAAQPPVTEVLPLTSLDAARTADTVRAMLAAPGSGLTLLADTTRNALVVRGFREQVEEVKAMLRALGEAPMAAGLRIIRVEHGDAATLAEMLQEMLPKLRPNPVRVVQPLDRAPAAKPPDRQKAADPKKPANKAASPVTLTPLGDKLLVTCEDPQVLALVQELVRLLSTSRQGGLEVIRLQHGKAVEAGRIVDELFNGQAGPQSSRRLERVRVVADSSNNTLLVKASPLDLRTIRRLLSKSLDTASTSDEVGVPRTFFLGPLRNARAEDLVKVLANVYRSDSKPTVTIVTDPRTNSLILRGSAAVFEDARKLVERLDIKVPKE